MNRTSQIFKFVGWVVMKYFEFKVTKENNVNVTTMVW